MGAGSSIEWTNATWNPVTGCTKISQGCKNCYAERMAVRLQAMGQPNYANGFRVTLHERMLDLPLTWKKPNLVFVNSMSDLFHETVPTEFIQRVFAVMERASSHTFQVLTKRADRLRQLAADLPWPANVWMGVSVENEDVAWRIDELRQVPAAVRFLSLEPLIGPLPSLGLDGIHWAIVGGESGHGARPMNPEWVRAIRNQCRRARVPFFFKQWGGVNKAKTGRELDGRTWDEMPANRGGELVELV
jgi:protein gp37